MSNCPTEILENENSNKIKVLLVEDDEDDYVLTRDLLSEIGAGKFALDWATTYEAALDEIARDVHDVCLFDYQLGARTGLELLREARASGSAIPIILLTGQGDREIDVEAMKAGASDYLIKGQLDASTLERSIRYSLEQKRIEAERVQHVREQEARAQAEAANRAKDDFLAMVSHELRAPLNTMLGWSRLLRTNKDNDEMFDRAVEAIERSVKTQSKFIEDLLDVTRIVNNDLRLETRPVELAAIVESCASGIRPSADDKEISLEIKCDNREIRVSADSERLQQIINNLLSNAVKFTPNGGRISVKLERAGDRAEITVSDTGKGIGPDFLPYVFDRYRQAAGSSQGRHGGLGLGLAIVKHLVEMHGGTIRAESAGENRGATFTLTLPISATTD